MPSHQRHIISGSERTALPGAKAVREAPGDERFEVTVRLRAQSGSPSSMPDAGQGDQLPTQRHYLSRDAFAAAHGAAASDLEKVAAFAAANHLIVVASSAARRSVVLSGTAKAFGTAFGTNLYDYEHDGGTYRGRTGSLSVPADLAGIVEGVFGLDDRPQSQPHFQRFEADSSAVARTPTVSPRVSRVMTALPPPTSASTPRRLIVGVPGAGDTRPCSSGGSGTVRASGVRSSSVSDRLFSERTMVGSLRNTCRANAPMKTHAPK